MLELLVPLAVTVASKSRDKVSVPHSSSATLLCESRKPDQVKVSEVIRRFFRHPSVLTQFNVCDGWLST